MSTNKRLKLSGAAYRKQKQAREDLKKQDEGAILKFLASPGGSSSSTDRPTEVTKEGETVLCPTQASDDSQNPSPVVLLNETDVEVEVEQVLEVEQTLEFKSAQLSIAEKNILNDAGLWPSEIGRDLRVELVKQGTSTLQNLKIEFPDTAVSRGGTSVKGEKRQLTSDWFFQTHKNGEKTLRTWMLYSPQRKSLFCFCCRVFGEKTESSFSSIDGFSTWWKLNPKVKDHENSATHQEAFLKWKELEMRLKAGITVDSLEQNKINDVRKKWVQILHRVVDMIRFLSKQNLSFRGHVETIKPKDTSNNSGNFIELTKLLSNYDPVLREHVVRCQNLNQGQQSYLSPQIQNELIDIMGQRVRKHILGDIEKAKYFSIIFDSTPDISHQDQLSQTIRYVKIDDQGKVEVKESFLDFIIIRGKTAEALTTVILDKLSRDGLQIENCRGQAYDNASVMAGVRTGVQQRIKEINPLAEFVPCNNHSLNLVGVHAASASVSAVTFFGTVQRCFTFFAASTHRWDVLKSNCSVTVKRAVDTRWSARKEAASCLKKVFSRVVDTLEILTDEEETQETREEAGLLLSALQTFPFLCFLYMWDPILSEVGITQKYLQQKDLDLIQCASKIRNLDEFLQRLDKENHWLPTQ